MESLAQDQVVKQTQSAGRPCGNPQRSSWGSWTPSSWVQTLTPPLICLWLWSLTSMPQCLRGRTYLMSVFQDQIESFSAVWRSTWRPAHDWWALAQVTAVVLNMEVGGGGYYLSLLPAPSPALKLKSTPQVTRDLQTHSRSHQGLCGFRQSNPNLNTLKKN